MKTTQWAELKTFLGHKGEKKSEWNTIMNESKAITMNQGHSPVTVILAIIPN